MIEDFFFFLLLGFKKGVCNELSRQDPKQNDQNHSRQFQCLKTKVHSKQVVQIGWQIQNMRQDQDQNPNFSFNHHNSK